MHLGFYEHVGAAMVVIYAALGFWYSRWLLLSLARGRWFPAVAVGLVLGTLCVQASYYFGHEGIWSARFGIEMLSSEFRLYSGALAEVLRLFLGFAIIVRTLGYTFRPELQRLVGMRWGGRLLIMDLLAIAILYWIANYHFNPSYGPNGLLRETAKKVQGEEDATSPAKYANLEMRRVLDHNPLFAGPARLRNAYGNSNSFDKSKQAFEQYADLEKLRDLEEELGVATRPLVEYTLSIAEQNPPVGDDRSESTSLALGLVFNSEFFLQCRIPYVLYGPYAVLAFVSIFIPLFWVPAASFRMYWQDLSGSLLKLNAANVEDLEANFNEFWKRSLEFVAKYAELPLLIAAFLGIELAFASRTLTVASFKLSMIAALSIVLLGGIALAVAMLIDSARRRIRAVLGEDETPEWLAKRDVRAFLEKIRYDSFVGAIASFASGSVVIGIVVEAIRRLSGY
jgi:hypothetical protein